ncbi:DUF4174 domain-containing protein [Ferruginivarius sediminum]|nr:DUF4174 domain-containing protein [Ferruginivarius sediminum]
MRRYLLLAAIFTAAFGGTAVAGMERFLWEKRPLVMTVPRADNAAYGQQLEVVANHAEGFAERDMVVIAVVGDERVEVDGRLAADLNGGDIRRRLNLPQTRFEVVLVGKDGAVKRRSTQAIPANVLFQTIDAMPMRQREMRRSGDGKPDD